MLLLSTSCGLPASSRRSVKTFSQEPNTRCLDLIKEQLNSPSHLHLGLSLSSLRPPTFPLTSRIPLSTFYLPALPPPYPCLLQCLLSSCIFSPCLYVEVPVMFHENLYFVAPAATGVGRTPAHSHGFHASPCRDPKTFMSLNISPNICLSPLGCNCESLHARSLSVTRVHSWTQPKMHTCPSAPAHTGPSEVSLHVAKTS